MSDGLIDVPHGHVAAVVTFLEMNERPAPAPIPESPLRMERWDAVDRRMRELDTQLDAADARTSERYAELSGRLLARWPVLDDAYHPDFAATLARDHAEIARALSSWPEAQARMRDQPATRRKRGRGCG